MPEAISIGEFARRCGLAVSALRFYDECGLLNPHRVDPVTGYRFYVESQLPIARLIRSLRVLDMPLATVRQTLEASASNRHAAVDERLMLATAQLEELRVLAAEVHRNIDEMEVGMKMVVDGTALRDAVGAVTPMASTDPGRRLLRGVLLEARQGSLRLVATDGYRLGLRDIPAVSGDQATFRGVASAADLQQWARASGEAQVAVEISDGNLVLHDEERRNFELMDGPYPDYEMFLSLREEAFPAILPVAELAAAVAEDTADPLGLSFDLASLTVRGTVSKHLEAAYTGPALDLWMDRGHLEDVLSASSGPDIAVEVSAPLSAVYFRSAADATSVSLVMPRQP
ncbi:MAG: MerR family transcriptional regulator [Actinobacteria bacterium]|nr:MerR family transcriptional regulator [Actinomycetota bacterium]